jgi:glutamate 5-kinase
LTLDSGAVAALIDRGSSLLAAGVISCEGDFSAGDAVELRDQNARPIARGLVAFDAQDIPPLLGKTTVEIEAQLGEAFAKELVHRDDLVLLRRA